MGKERLHKALLIATVVICSVILLCLFGFLLWKQGVFSAPQPGTVPGTSDAVETTVTEPTTEPTEPPIPLNRFSPEDFEFQGDYLACNSEWYLRGIDVSKYQGEIDWQQVKDAGMSFAMIRVGYRGYGQAGGVYADKLAQTNYEGAKRAGLKVGVYFFSQARTVKEAQEEAKFLLDIVKDWDVDLPLVCDWEYFNKNDTPRVYGLSKRRVTDCVKAFCDTIKEAGYYPMVYAANYIVKNKLYMNELADYGIWYADYRNYLNSDFRVDMWQYTSTGRVSGISGNVDLNVLFLENSIFEKIFAED